MSHNSDRPIAALCVSGRSIYKHLPGVEAYDARRDARTFPANTPAVAHPPCRCWSKYLRHQAKPLDANAEMELGRWCVRTILQCGGVLEHPAGSHLFAEMGLPMPNHPEEVGFTVYVEQKWFGYATRKPTWVFVAGVPMHQLPPLPFSLVNDAKSPVLSSFGRSRTMPGFARWLCQVARLANPPGATQNVILPHVRTADGSIKLPVIESCEAVFANATAV